MQHKKVDSSNIYSIAHEGDALEVRFTCNKCKGAGCESCTNAGHSGTYKYSGVPADIHSRVIAGEPVEKGGKASVGSAFNRLVRGKFKGEKE